MTSRPRKRLRFALALSTALASCNNDETKKIDSPPGDLNALVAAVPAGPVVSGFKHGQLRRNIEVAGFSISKRPITWVQYRACMHAGVCGRPAATCANSSGADQDAVLCAGYDNARAYCAWSGGRLPVLSEWFLAARGQSPQRFSWGDAAPTCDLHPLASEPSSRRESSTVLATRISPDAKTECGEPLAERFQVGRHAAGASPHGLEDVLIARGELVGGRQGSLLTVCASPERGCIVHGLMPGAIDAVKAAYDAPAASGREQSAEHSYAFRCVWSKEGL